MYRSRKDQWNDFKGRLFAVPAEGGPSEELPLPRGGFCSYSPDLKQMAYNRVFREFRTWKRYRGGQADDIWIYDFETKTTVNITNNPAQDIFPMWHGNTIYFLSDRDENKRMNLYAYDLASHKTDRKLTSFADYDVKFPSLGDNAIVFENGGYIYRMDLQNEKAERVPIAIGDDMAVGRGGLDRRQQERQQLRNRPGRQPGPVRRARGYLHRTGQVRQHAQPDQHLGRARAGLQMVPRRQVDRLHIGRVGRR